MVHSHVSTLFLAVLEEWEIDNPQARELVLVAQTELVSDLQTKLAELLACLHCIVTAEDEDEVARLGIEGCLHRLENLLCIELVNT